MRKNILRLKFKRDIIKNFIQMTVILILSMFGSFSYTGMDSTAQMIQQTVDSYFISCQLPDFWISLPHADRTVLAKLRHLPGIESAEARGTAELDTDISPNAHLTAILYNGPMETGRPHLIRGSLLSQSDKRGCLLDRRFAEINEINPGDSITVRKNGIETHLTIRGLIMTPEFVYVADNDFPEPEKYGFLLANKSAFPELPLNQIVVTLKPGSKQQAVANDILTLLPYASVTDRENHVSTKNITNERRIFESMRFVFPLLAWFISTCMVMSTFGRIIQNQRMQIGLLKSLGYDNKIICFQYLKLSFFPSLFGSLIGFWSGYRILPPIFWKNIINQRNLPYCLYPKPSASSWISTLITVILATGISLFVYLQTAHESEASLLHPKPPQKGSQIFLDSVHFIWNRLTFSGKAVARNLFRRPFRTFLFFFAVLFCNMLMIISFGLMDTINTLTHRHYIEAHRWDMAAQLNPTAGMSESYTRRIPAEKTESMMVLQVSVFESDKIRIVPLTVLEDQQTMLHLGHHAAFIPLPRDSAAISKKLASILHLQPGDSIQCRIEGRKQPVTLKIGALVESIMSQGFFMNQHAWDLLHAGSFVPNMLCISGVTSATTAALDHMEEIRHITYPQTQIIQALSILSFLRSIFLIMQIIALAIVFCVSINLSMLNLMERMREYALLLVQGFHIREIRLMIACENLIPALIGILSGIYPGILMTDVIIRLCETEGEAYYGAPSLRSIILSFLIILASVLIIQLLITAGVKRINMCNDLKSFE